MFRVKQILAALLLCFVSVFGYTPTVQAAQANSTNYGVSEVNFGSGGELHACSTAYCAKQSAGELTVGNTASTTYQAQGGANTNREEYLEITQSSTTVSMGNITTASTGSGSSQFSVKNYLSSGYIVTISGNAPTNANGSHTITGMAAADISRQGTEQFGLNLRANTTPAVGADVQQIPDATFGFGTPAAAYNVVNNFKFVSGNTIAQSTKSSGTTTYTISFIENIATATPAGQYKTRMVINVIPTF